MQHFTALSAGPELAQFAGKQGRVLAVLSNAVYLRCDGGQIVGVTGQSAEDGPFTLRVRDIDALVRLLKGRESLTFACTGAFLELEGLATLDRSSARQWHASLPGEIAEVAGRIRAVRALLSLLQGSWCSNGVCGLPAYLFGAHHSLPVLSEVPRLRTKAQASDMLLRRLAERVTSFQVAATDLEAHPASQALVSLLGLGAGLTPSGDDIVAGILAILVWQARLGAIPADFARFQVESIRNTAPTRTNDISVRLLWHAGEGLLYAPAMELGAALLAGDANSVADPARRLLAIGHSSGVDLATGLLAGVVAGIEIESRSKVPSY
ncbi:MAG: DUF2877 domain-containing protein [Chloroflexota bacterium]|nr:DUF2877 domain-containing protein [Chloroflexota bacterium]MDQ5866817.1 DUF2877 domain-containing protein [Chloroflexota bacterium]